MRKRCTAFAILSLFSLMAASCDADSSQADFSDIDTSTQNTKSRMDVEIRESQDRKESEVAFDKDVITDPDDLPFPLGNLISWSYWSGGVGYYQEEGQPAQIIRRGDVIECAPGVRHWHGGSAGTEFA